MQIIVNSPDTTKFITDLATAPMRLAKNNIRWVKNLTNFVYLRMKYYSKSKRRGASSRGTGSLSNSIRKTVVTTATYTKGVAFVPSNIVYQNAVEYGFKIQRKNAIGAKGNFMTFHYTSWQKAIRSMKLRKQANASGYFFFPVVSRGKYEGLYFTYKSFVSLMEYYNKKREQLAKDVIGAITFNTNI